MILILRRTGRGNWSQVRIAYDPARQAEWPTAIDARVGTLVAIFGVTYRVSRVES